VTATEPEAREVTATRRARYVALYERPDHEGGNYFRVAHLEFPAGFVPPPTIGLHIPLAGTHTFTYAQTQAEIAATFGLTQQTVSRWLQRTPPELPS